MWLTILLAVLPLLAQLFKYLVDLDSKGHHLAPRQAARIDKAVWYCDQIAQVAPRVGCVKGGMPPDKECSTEDW